MDPVEGPWLHGYALTNYKSLRDDLPLRIGPLGKVNFLVGRNNHGKSTVMRAAAMWAGSGNQRTETKAFKGFTLVPLTLKTLRSRVDQHGTSNVDTWLADGQLLDIGLDRVGLWVEGSTEEITPKAVSRQLQQLASQGLRTASNEPYPATPGQVVRIPAFRELRPADVSADNVSQPGIDKQNLASGKGLVQELGRWQAPINAGTAPYREAKERWSRLKDFMRDVLEDEVADLEIANNQADLNVHLSQAGEMLHIDDLGDGVKQVLMIAAACILYDDHLVLLEEPEIHLHAGLQRKLMRFLAEKTSSQYIIATHSAHVLDLAGAHIFHVTHDGKSTRVAPAVRASDVQRVCQDLGYMASDLLQANYTIWVEGPSDRIYWKRWLELVAPELVEGVHFTVMSYGGYLLDGIHIRDEPEAAVEDLIHLLQLGRECSVITDSDKDSAEAPLRDTVTRLKEEATSAGSGHLITCEWVRTVENLLPRDLFRATVIERHPKAGLALKSSTTTFDQPFDGMKTTTYSKVEIARLCAPKLAHEDIGAELMTEVTGLADRIRRANGFPAL